MEARPELPIGELEALRRVMRRADELCSALNESEEVTISGSDFEQQFRGLEEALAALPQREAVKKENWRAIAEDWRFDAPGG